VLREHQLKIFDRRGLAGKGQAAKKRHMQKRPPERSCARAVWGGGKSSGKEEKGSKAGTKVTTTAPASL